jgi:hypothetical protein
LVRGGPGCLNAARMALAELVRDALRDRFARSNALLSGASSLSRPESGRAFSGAGSVDHVAPAMCFSRADYQIGGGIAPRLTAQASSK